MTRKILYEPFAHNGLPADYMFFQRKYYNTQPIIYPSNLPRPIDMWNERPLYGKVDTFERFVFPFTPSLKTVGSGLLAINFVADAYKAMATFMQGASAGARSSAGSLVHIETPVKAADDLPLLYERYFKEDLDPLFVGSFLTSLRQAEIKSFADYLRFYVTFARANPQFPHSQVDFLASNRVSNRVSGLMIEVPVAGDKRLPYDADKPKWDHFLSQTFFPDYAQIAEGFGFYVNKHIPYMFVHSIK